jgi:hypothetical protein
MTFEEQLIEKSTDFPELEDGKKVSWTVTYCTITKPGQRILQAAGQTHEGGKTSQPA